jgi:MFS family permease
MIPRLTPERRGLIVAALGSSLTVSWASSYYIPAVLAVPMAEDLGLSPVWVFGAFSMAMLVSALVGPWAGARIDGFGGRGVLMASNFVFATGLTILAVAPSPVVMFAGWAVIGLGMGIGLYEAGFATLAGIYGKDARGPITGITLIAGFASTVGWPLSGLMLATWGWREACIGWALIHLVVALPLNASMPKGTETIAALNAMVEDGPPPSRMALGLLAFVFAATWFNSTAMAAHLPGLLQAAGASTTSAVIWPRAASTRSSSIVSSTATSFSASSTPPQRSVGCARDASSTPWRCGSTSPRRHERRCVGEYARSTLIAGLEP